MLHFDEVALVAVLDRLEPWQRATFAAMAAERIFPAYLKFHADTADGDVDVLREALDFAWASITSRRINRDDIRLREEAAVSLIPEEDKSWTPLHAYADDAASSVAYALRTLTSGKPQEAAWAARRVYEALDHFVTTRDDVTPKDAATERGIVQDQLIQRELERQQADLRDLARAGRDPVDEVIQSFRSRATQQQALPL